MDTAYHPAFGGPAAYRFEAMPEAPDAQVRMTIRKAVGWALCQCYTPEVQKAAADALELGHGHPVKGVWEAIKPHIRFQQDYDTGQQLAVDDPRKRSIVETMIPPASMAQLIERGTAVEDCDGFTMYGAALLCALGIPCCMCTVSADPEKPWEFTHVYLVAYWNGQRIPMDLSHGPYMGWECPNLGRKREWPVSGETLRPSVILPLLLAVGAGGFLLWRRAA